jgi:hypothetical protein
MMVSICIMKVPHSASVIRNISLPFAKAFTKLTRVACKTQLASLNYWQSSAIMYQWLFTCPEPSSDVGLAETFSLHQEHEYLIASHSYTIGGSFSGEMRISLLGHGGEEQR